MSKQIIIAGAMALFTTVCAIQTARSIGNAKAAEKPIETPAIVCETAVSIDPQETLYAPLLPPVRTRTVIETVTETVTEIYTVTAEEAESIHETMLAKTVYGEARGCSVTEQAAVIWCILNRVDSENPYFPDTISGCITQPNQFFGYREDFPVTDEILQLVRDVLARWELEKLGVGDAGRVLPKEYLYFTGDGRHNHFTVEWGSENKWDWRLPSPYEEG